MGQNPPAGVVIHYFLKEKPDKGSAVSLEVLGHDDKVIRTFTTKEGPGTNRLEPKQGMNRLSWDLRYPAAESFPGMVLWGSLTGPRAVPGTYRARLRSGPHSQTVPFEVKADPRVSATADDLQAQLRFLLEARDKLTETHRAIKQIRDVRDQVVNLGKRLKGNKDFAEVAESAQALDKKLTVIEEALHQTKARSSQDVLNYPIRLNNKLASLAGVAGAGDNRPTEQAVKVKEELTTRIDGELVKLREVMEKDLPRFNALLAEKKVPGVFAEPGGNERRDRAKQPGDR